MLIQERHREIPEWLGKAGSPRVAELPFDTRQQSNPSQKRAIAPAAAASVVEDEAVAPDASTTVCELAFRVHVTPAWGRTPFNSYLFVFQRPGDEA